MSDTENFSLRVVQAEEKPSAWMHPEAGWVNAEYSEVAMHCRNDGPRPIPLFRALFGKPQALTDFDVWSSMPCDDQFALATRIAANVGYVLVPEPEIDP